MNKQEGKTVLKHRKVKLITWWYEYKLSSVAGSAHACVNVKQQAGL